MAKTLTLIPHPNDPKFDLNLKVTLEHVQNPKKDTWRVEYFLKGDLDKIILGTKPPSPPWKREDDLWKSTCFELFLFPEFLSPQPTESYFELNFSPLTGSWNAYEFDRPRIGMRDSRVFQLNALTANLPKPNEFIFFIEFDLIGLSLVDQFFVNPAAIIETKVGEKLHYSTKHLKDKPDFHDLGLMIHRVT